MMNKTIEYQARPDVSRGLYAWRDLRYWLTGTGYGALLWAVPFLISIPFFNRQGELQTDLFLFKGVMAVCGSLTGVSLLVRYLARVHADRVHQMDPGSSRGGFHFWRFGLFTGILWLLVNWGLDFLILLPMNGQSPQEYMTRIGLGYLAIPICATGIALAMDRVIQRNRQSAL